MEISVRSCHLYLIMVTEGEGRKNGTEAILQETVVIESVIVSEKSP